MGKELEALEFIVEAFNKYAKKPNDIGEFFKFTNAEETLQKGLTRLEKLEKAIEIFKRIGYGTDYLEMIMKCENYQEYQAMFEDEPEQICKNENEFNLFKEVFCNDR